MEKIFICFLQDPFPVDILYKPQKYSLVNFSSHGQNFFLFTRKDGESPVWSFYVQMAADGRDCEDFTATINVFRYDDGEDSFPSFRTIAALVPIDYKTDAVPDCALEISDSRMQKILAPRDSKFVDKLYFGVSVAIRKKRKQNSLY